MVPHQGRSEWRWTCSIKAWSQPDGYAWAKPKLWKVGSVKTSGTDEIVSRIVSAKSPTVSGASLPSDVINLTVVGEKQASALGFNKITPELHNFGLVFNVLICGCEKLEKDLLDSGSLEGLMDIEIRQWSLLRDPRALEICRALNILKIYPRDLPTISLIFLKIYFALPWSIAKKVNIDFCIHWWLCYD